MPAKKETEDGSAVDVSTPTTGARVPVIPAISADSSVVALARCTAPISSGVWRTTMTPSSPPKLPLAREKR